VSEGVSASDSDIVCRPQSAAGQFAPPAPTSARDAFQRAFAGYLANNVSLQCLRAVIVRCVLEDNRLAKVIGDSFAAALVARCLPSAAYLTLVSDLEQLPLRGSPANKPDNRVLRDRVEIQQQIAVGGIGVLYRAIDLQRRGTALQDRTVAVKMLAEEFRDDPDALRSLRREARIARRLSHPNIRAVYDFDRAADDYFVTMEWLEGESLANRLDRTGSRPIPWAAGFRILAAVGAGLEHAHRRGIVHGDIKPGNVFVTTAGQIKLLDFGQASIAEAVDRRPEKMAISPAYASCERHEGARAEISDDIFALAVMAYRILSGARPFGRYTPLRAEQAGVRALRPTGLVAPQWRMLQRGLAWRRAHRPDSVTEFIAGLLPPTGPRDRLRPRKFPLHVAA